MPSPNSSIFKGEIMEDIFTDYHKIQNEINKINTLAIGQILECKKHNNYYLCKVHLINKPINIEDKVQKEIILYEVPYFPLMHNKIKVDLGGFVIGDKVVVGFLQDDNDNVFSHITDTRLNNSIPNTARKFDFADGIIISGIFTTQTTDTTIINDGHNLNIKTNKSVTLESTNNISIKASSVSINGTLSVNGENYNAHKHLAGALTTSSGPVTGISGNKL